MYKVKNKILFISKQIKNKLTKISYIKLFGIAYIIVCAATAVLFINNRQLSFLADMLSVILLICIFLITKTKKLCQIQWKVKDLACPYFMGFCVYHWFYTRNFVAAKSGTFCLSIYLIYKILNKYSIKKLPVLILIMCDLWIYFGILELIVRLLNPDLLPSIINKTNQIVTRGPISVIRELKPYALCSLGFSQGTFACILMARVLISSRCYLSKITPISLWLFCGTVASLISFIIVCCVGKIHRAFVFVGSSLFCIIIIFRREFWGMKQNYTFLNMDNFANINGILNGMYFDELLLWPLQEFFSKAKFLNIVFGNIGSGFGYIPQFAENKIFNVLFQIPLWLGIIYIIGFGQELQKLKNNKSMLYLVVIFVFISSFKCAYFYSPPGCIFAAIILNIPFLWNRNRKE